MSTCNKTSNNKYFDCPARMDDGRAFTDYRASSTVDEMIKYSNNVMGSNDYRQFLIHNGNNIINVAREYTKEKIGNGDCNYVDIPFNRNCVINDRFSRCTKGPENGIGIYNMVMPKENIKVQDNDNYASDDKKVVKNKMEHFYGGCNKKEKDGY
jgi:hypothetical protein